MKKKCISREILCQLWLHSHEEDTETEEVFRPASFSFPPARGRSGFELHDNGSFRDIRIGPTDRPEEGVGTWEFDDAAAQLSIQCDVGPRQVLHICSADKERLVIKRG